MNEFSKQALIIGLSHLFEKRYFDICLLQSLCSLAHVIPSNEDAQAFHAIHCVDYDKMTPAFRRELKQKIVAIFNSEPFELTAADFPPKLTLMIEPPKEHGFKDRIQRMLGFGGD